MSDTDIDKLSMYHYNKAIDTNLSNLHSILEKEMEHFMAFYRENFPWATVLPKMHILEDHTIPWLMRHHLGAGLMGEQGAESIHAHMMRLERIHQGIANDVDRLKYIVKEQMLESAPSLTSLRSP